MRTGCSISILGFSRRCRSEASIRSVCSSGSRRSAAWRRNGEGKRAELMPALPQRAFCEWLGTAVLLAAVVGSGIMAQKLAGDDAVALLCNTLPTGAILAVLILIFGPLSGAHFNPAVSIGFALRSELPWSDTGAYVVAQVLGGLAGVWIAHLMFELPVCQFSLTDPTVPGP